MIRFIVLFVVAASVLFAAPAILEAAEDASPWTIYIANDNCPDYTWGLTEEQTRQAFADVVKGHLDEMKRTDGEPSAGRDRYNMAVTQEALCFVERYPDRKDELIRRIREGRMYVSPYLCNSLWAFQTAEGAIRTFYPYRRLEREWGISTDCAHHIEEPSLPWGVPTLLAGCGFRSLSVPYYQYDSTFGSLKNPPLFLHEGPDGSRVQVVMDPWACSKAHYTQGAGLLRDPAAVEGQWLPHYASLGDSYPLRAILASGTHGDIKPHSGGQARGFAEAIIGYNARPDAPARLVNATFPQFWQEVNEVQSKTPFLETISGSFGHAWDVWPVCLAKCAADMREGERTLLAAETLLAVTGHGDHQVYQSARKDLQQAEWCWAMLSDHAWNGTSDQNKRHNAELRRRWCEELARLGHRTMERAWSAANLVHDEKHLTLFNSLSLPRRDVVCVLPPEDVTSAADQGRELPCQIVEENDQPLLCFVSPEVPGFGWKSVELHAGSKVRTYSDKLVAAPTPLESPFYRLDVDLKTGGIAGLVNKATGTDLVTAGQDRSLCQTIYFDGREHTLTDVTCEPIASGPVLARLRIRGTAAGIRVTNVVTVYAELDRVDFDLRIHKPTTTKEERLCQVFPILRDTPTLRIATAGAVVRPRPQPEGDLLPWADRRRFAVGEFLSAASKDVAVTIVPLDAFALRLDLDPITFEALGNDQNYREVIKDQNGVIDFRFRYRLRAHAGGYQGADTIGFSRAAAAPLLAITGHLERRDIWPPSVAVDPRRAVATCLKPADDDQAGGSILRLWEVAGHQGPVTLKLAGYRKAIQTDLLERDLHQLPLADSEVTVELKPHGYCAIRLLP